MVLHHVANSSGLVIKRGAALDAEVFGHGDLHAFHIMAVPEGLEQRIGEAEEQHVVHRFLAEVMIDPKYSLFVESLEQDPVELLCGQEVGAEGLFHDDTSAGARAARLTELLHDSSEHGRRDGQIKSRPLRAVEFLAELCISRRIRIIPANVMQQAHEFLERRRVNATALFKTLPSAVLERGQIRSRTSNSNNGHVE